MPVSCEAPLRRVRRAVVRGSREAELPEQVCSQAGAWERENLRTREKVFLSVLIVALAAGHARAQSFVRQGEVDETPAASSKGPPPVVPPAHYKNAVPAPTRYAAPADGAWWHIFRDPALDRLETSASGANQDLRQAVARIDEARQQTRTAAAGYLPTVESNLGYTRVRTTNSNPDGRAELVGNAGAFASLFGAGGTTTTGKSGNPSFTSRGLSATYNEYRAPLSVSYELDVFGRVRHAYASARAAGQAAEADRQAVALGLSAEVATGYFQLRALDSQIAVLRQGVDLRADAVRLSQERVTGGVAGPLDLSRARVELDNTRADLDEALRQRAATENDLAALCGQSASEFHLPIRGLEDAPPPVIPPGVPMLLLSRRPDLREAERRLAAANEDIGVAHAQFLPTFNIQGNAGLQAAYGSELFEAGSRQLSIMGQVHIPIFEGGRNLADLRAARARRDAALASYRGTAITAYKEVETALSDLRQRAAQAEERRRAVADAGQVLGFSQKRYLEGATNYFDVVDAQRSQLGAQLNGVQTLEARFAATVTLVRAIGGSWGADDASKSR